MISLAKEYSSITIKKGLLVDILNAIKKLDEEEIYIDTVKLNDSLKDIITTESNYKNYKYVVVTSIIKCLLDREIIAPFQNRKRGKYVIEYYDKMLNLINNPICINK